MGCYLPLYFPRLGADVKRLLIYLGLRSLTLFLAVIVGVYLVILVANMGGELDKIREAQIREEVRVALQSPSFAQLSEEERSRAFVVLVEARRRAEGLDRPFFSRSLAHLWRGITLNLGRGEKLTSDAGSNQVRAILVERLPHTLLLWGTGQLLLFLFALSLALSLALREGSVMDRVVVALAPTSAAPAWVYGVLLLLLFASQLKLLPYGGFVEAPPPTTTLAYTTSVLKHLVLPVASLFLAGLFETAYIWRNLFLLHAHEDFVETGRAKGLPPRLWERRYLLRPALPPILTAFVLRMIRAWMGGILTETVFAWPGLGRLLWLAIRESDVPVLVGATVVYGYLLAGSVLLLDFVCAWADPRTRLRAR